MKLDHCMKHKCKECKHKCEEYLNEERKEITMLCDTCRHDTICKNKNETIRIEKQIDEIVITNILSPVKLKVECRNFDRKNLKQDGMNPNTNHTFAKTY